MNFNDHYHIQTMKSAITVVKMMEYNAESERYGDDDNYDYVERDRYDYYD